MVDLRLAMGPWPGSCSKEALNICSTVPWDFHMGSSASLKAKCSDSGVFYFGRIGFPNGMRDRSRV